MGVKHLWSIIDETKTKEMLDFMRGKIVSVDLSIWIVEASKTLQFKTSILKPHLRNMFYRILALRNLGIKLIFVTEGEAPDLKQNTMKKRNEARYGTKIQAKTRVGRSRFQNIIKECCCLLNLLGMPYVKAAGEAEQMCASLNQYGYSDGCLTNDGDFLLYGGQTIFRDFGIDPKDPHIFVYQMEKIKKRLNITRKDMIGIGLLAGCDYSEGVPGVGRTSINSLLQERLGSDDLLDRFKQWYDPKPHHRPMTKTETLIFKKTLKVKSFINQDIIDEYLVGRDKLSGLGDKLKWGYPDIKGLQEFLEMKMEWPFEYTLSKVMQLASSTYLEKLSDNIFYPVPIAPTHIVKTRCQRGVSLVEIKWEKDATQMYNVDRRWDNCPDSFNTLENHEFVLKVLPDLVDTYVKLRESKSTKVKTKKSRSKKNAEIETKVLDECNSLEVENKIELNSKYVLSQESLSQDLVCQGFSNVANTNRKGDFLSDVLCDDIKGMSLHDADQSEPNSSADEQDNVESDCILPLFQRLHLREEKINVAGKNSALTEPSCINNQNTQSCDSLLPYADEIPNNSTDLIDMLTTSAISQLVDVSVHLHTPVSVCQSEEHITHDKPIRAKSSATKENIVIHDTPKNSKRDIGLRILTEGTPLRFTTETPISSLTANTPNLTDSHSPLVASTPLVREPPVLQDISNFSNLGDSIILGHSLDLFDGLDELDTTPCVKSNTTPMHNFDRGAGVRSISLISGFGDSILTDSLDSGSVCTVDVPDENKPVDHVPVSPENYEDFLRKKFQISVDLDQSGNITPDVQDSLTKDKNCSMIADGSPLSLSERLHKGFSKLQG